MASQRVRIVCISDTHNQTPKLPSGDILIHAGDLTNQGSYSELQKTVNWLEKADFRVKIVVAGNHDVTLHEKFYSQHGQYFHYQGIEDPQRCIDLLRSSSCLLYLDHESTIIYLPQSDGTQMKLKVFGSPYSPSRGLWAFGYAPEGALDLWHQIPLDADIVVTHTPAKFHCDESSNRSASGCDRLREALWRVRPRLAVCGHIHEGRGVEVVEWDLDSPNVKFKERGVRRIPDETGTTKKQFLVDLTSKSKQPLRNDGSIGDLVPHSRRDQTRGVEVDGSSDSLPSVYSSSPSLPQQPFPDFHKANRPIPTIPEPQRENWLSTHGQGAPVVASPSAMSPRSDTSALSGRQERRETCFINAAFMSSNYPHKGGKKFNKPIVIDLEIAAEDGRNTWLADAVLAAGGIEG